MLMALSIVGLTQFCFYYWRTVVTGVAEEPLSDDVLAAAGLSISTMDGRAFPALAGLYKLTPYISPQNDGYRGSLFPAHAYFSLVRAVAGMLHFSAVVAWSQREMALCARYAAVVVAYRMKSNLACSAAIRSC